MNIIFGERTMKIAIIGGGASGMACAVQLKTLCADCEVTVLEKMPRVLKKLLVTGNGRCNITNINSSSEFYRGDSGLIKAVLGHFPVGSNIRFFEEMGLPLKEEAEGRVYPRSMNASSAVNALLFRARELGVNIVTDYTVKTVAKKGNGFLINDSLYFDCAVVASGGCSAGVHGSDGFSFRLFKKLGIKFTEPRPALCGLLLKDFPRSLKGVRNVCNVTLKSGGREMYSETGEVQFNDYGVSGIPIMQLSGLLRECEKGKTELFADCAPDLEEEELFSYLKRIRDGHPQMPALNLASGLLPKPLALYVIALSGLGQSLIVKEIDDGTLLKITRTVKNLRFCVSGARDFKDSQVTSGGVGSDELNPDTLELRRIKGMYACGEAVNADGLCGGHNLQWAWSSGRLCAEAIAEREKSLDKN